MGRYATGHSGVPNGVTDFQGQQLFPSLMGPQNPGTELKSRPASTAWVLSSWHQGRGTPASLISEHFDSFVFYPPDHMRTLSIEMAASLACFLTHDLKSMSRPAEEWDTCVCV